MNLSLSESAWTGKALLIAGAVAVMLVGDENLRAAPEPALTNQAQAQWIQYEAPAMPKTIVRPASSTAQGSQLAGSSQQRWVF
ncbi:hypothetical protein [Pseudomonas sp.]|uniref:hypothetical protein n=1 Tax=Pseudomonas sp. TaxID=306 RepID=UPI00272CD71D|nr:hypothetical protein [Pseudomonas sp.]